MKKKKEKPETVAEPNQTTPYPNHPLKCFLNKNF
jgi:hypothetical protein